MNFYTIFPLMWNTLYYIIFIFILRIQNLWDQGYETSYDSFRNQQKLGYTLRSGNIIYTQNDLAC